jgi:hypothetical protein
MRASRYPQRATWRSTGDGRPLRRPSDTRRHDFVKNSSKNSPKNRDKFIVSRNSRRLALPFGVQLRYI